VADAALTAGGEPAEDRPALDSADIKALLAKDATTGATEFERRQCRHCGGVHQRACPRVKRLRFDTERGGALVEVEFWPEGSWSGEHVIWPEMLGVLDDDKAGGGDG
jgi:hypothetical protein